MWRGSLLIYMLTINDPPADSLPLRDRRAVYVLSEAMTSPSFILSILPYCLVIGIAVGVLRWVGLI